jgi:hypothetical protein
MDTMLKISIMLTATVYYFLNCYFILSVSSF